MDFVAVVDQVIVLLRQRGRMTYRTLQRQFQLDDDALHDLTEELLYAHPEVRDDAGRGLVWTGDVGPAPATTAAPVAPPGQAPLAYTPPYLAEKILTSRSALELTFRTLFRPSDAIFEGPRVESGAEAIYRSLHAL